MAANQLENIKEMASAPFGKGQGMSREEYIKHLAEKEEQELLDNDNPFVTLI